jgi:hypothetical protein
MFSVRRTAAVGAAGALAAGIVISGLGSGVAGAATYPPVTPTVTPTTPANPGTFKCSARAVNRKDRISVRLTATGDAAKYNNYVFKIWEYIPSEKAWRVNNINYRIQVGQSRTVDREAGRYRAKCFGEANKATFTQRVRLTR